MSIDRFDKERFETALPTDTKSGERLWQELGLEEREYAYLIKVRDGVCIKIRSSVKPDGRAAETGKDSIRCWLVREDGSPMGNKVQSYVKRSPGWAERMTGVLRELWKRALMVEDCPGCGKPLSIFKTKKPGKNKGRLFVKCWDCKTLDTFRWLDESKPADYGKPKFEKILPMDESIIREHVNALPTKKAKVQLIRDFIETNERGQLWALTRIYDMQTESEKSSQHTYHLNKVGFNGVDAEILSSFAEQYEKRGSLSPKQMKLAAKKLPKYSKQLLTLMQ